MLSKIKCLDFGATGVIFDACKLWACKYNIHSICLSVALALC